VKAVKGANYFQQVIPAIIGEILGVFYFLRNINGFCHIIPVILFIVYTIFFLEDEALTI